MALGIVGMASGDLVFALLIIWKRSWEVEKNPHLPRFVAVHSAIFGGIGNPRMCDIYITLLSSPSESSKLHQGSYL